ncbi:MAG TPA: ATP-dependent Clp protease adaptor ClpS [Fimbriimonas sp.]|nr:ATP-dependent Clp protease adaptor ClpS [Fimbriimonas sp.]
MRIRSEGPGVLDRPEVDVEQSSGSGKGGWIVTVYNNETNTFAEVEHILMVATGCDYEEAWMETWEIDRLGKSVVHHSDQEECENVAAVIAQIGIEVRVSCE